MTKNQKESKYIAVKKMVADAFPVVAQLIGVDHWNFSIDYIDLKEYVQASVWLDVPYRRAKILVDPTKIADMNDLIGVLVHECFHVTQWAWDNYRTIISQKHGKGIPKNEVTRIEEYAYHHAQEETVAGQIQLFEALGGFERIRAVIAGKGEPCQREAKRKRRK